jgi:hypothetical protein
VSFSRASVISCKAFKYFSVSSSFSKLAIPLDRPLPLSIVVRALSKRFCSFSDKRAYFASSSAKSLLS